VSVSANVPKRSVICGGHTWVKKKEAARYYFNPRGQVICVGKLCKILLPAGFGQLGAEKAHC